MLQTNDIRRRLVAIEAAIGHASQACSAERDVPGELRTYIQRLDKQSDTARTVLASRDEERIRKLVDELEMLGGRARQVCRSGATISPQMTSAVNRMHDELAELKQQLH
jgi:acyl transferase domain-containing protein